MASRWESIPKGGIGIKWRYDVGYRAKGEFERLNEKRGFSEDQRLSQDLRAVHSPHRLTLYG